MSLDLFSSKILVVDDNRSNIIFLESMLDDMGYKSISTATCAAEVYEIIENEDIELILLDVIMPEISGLEVCKHIRSNPKFNQLAIIMVTGDDSDDTLVKSFEYGADDYILKPINMTNLQVRIKNVLMSFYKDALILNQNRLLAANETVQMLAHQWRQPLNLINSTMMQLSIDYEFDKLTQEKLEEYTSKITKSTQVLSSTLDEFSKVCKHNEEASSLLVNTTVSRSIELIKHRAESNAITIKTEFGDMKNIKYFHNELVNVLIAIFTNSIEAFNRNLTKDDRFISISTKQKDKSTLIVIKDNAGGVNPKILPRVFEPYVSCKKEKNGVGLGLYNAFHTLNKYMNATIDLNSQGKTTEVIIEIPNS